jgi:hypothetical protein
MTWRTAGVSRILTEREHITLIHGYRQLACRVVLLCKQGVYAVNAVLWRVVIPAISRLVCPSEIYCVYIGGDCGLNLHPMSSTGTPTLIGAMQDDGVVYDFD